MRQHGVNGLQQVPPAKGSSIRLPYIPIYLWMEFVLMFPKRGPSECCNGCHVLALKREIKRPPEILALFACWNPHKKASLSFAQREAQGWATRW